MTDSTRYRVEVPCLVARLVSGSLEHVYQGDFLPAETDPANVEHLLGLGFVSDLEAVPSIEEDLAALKPTKAITTGGTNR